MIAYCIFVDHLKINKTHSDILQILPSITHPATGSSTIARGCSSPSEMSTVRLDPLSLDTSIRLDPESVQYRLRAIQSTAIPSGCITSVGITISCPKTVRKKSNNRFIKQRFHCLRLVYMLKYIEYIYIYIEMVMWKIKMENLLEMV